MQFSLFKHILASAVILAATMTTSTLGAETLKVPFNFTVAGKSCPAGTYRVERSLLLGNGQVTLSSMSTSQRFTWNLRPGDPAPTDTRVILRFNQTGNAHELTSVQYGSGVTPKIRENARQAESMAPLGMHGQ